MKHIQTTVTIFVLFNLFIFAPVQSQSSDSSNMAQAIKRPRFQIQLNGIYSILETGSLKREQRSFPISMPLFTALAKCMILSVTQGRAWVYL
jgi:hypothetical protein